MPGWISPWEIALVLVVALLLFGGKRLPEMGRSLGQGMREFKNAITGRDEDEHRAIEPPVETQDTTARAPVREHDTV